MIQAWNAFIDNIERIGSDPWLSKLDANRIKFETRTTKKKSTDYREMQRLFVSRGVIRARVVRLAHNLPLRKPMILITGTGTITSLVR